MTQIAVIDYGMGNLHSVAKALQHAGTLKDHKEKLSIQVTADPKLIKNADRVLLPGVGAMRDCMGEMQRLELIDVIKEAAISKPFLGICIGMQALLSRSDENNGVDCLDVFKGQVEHFDKNLNQDGNELKIPHMGWNQVKQSIAHPLWDGIEQQQRFYFVHSYVAAPDNESDIAATTEYGQEFTSALAKDNIFATQFHPEKSADAGLKLFSNFINWNGQA